MFMEKMRQGAQSLTAKIIFVVIMVSFALAGIGGYAVRKPNIDPAEVDGIAVRAMDYDRLYRERKQIMQRNAGEHYQEFINANPNFLASVRKQVLDDMIYDIIVNNRVANLGFRVSDDLIKQVIIKDIDEFKVDGKFNNEKYLEVITRYGYQSASQFANDQKIRIQQALYTEAFRGAQFALPYETKHFLSLSKQERNVDVYNISPEAFSKAVVLDEAALTKFYKEHTDKYVQPEQVKVDYILLSKDDLAKTIAVADADIQKFYEEHSENFIVKGKYHVEHIFVNAPDEAKKEEGRKKITEAAEKIKAGELFETVASQMSDDILTANKGGDLGWQPFGTLEKEFEETVRNMETVNQVSDVVETKYGFHLIKFIEAKPESKKPIEEVKEIIVNKLNEGKIDDVYAAKLEQLNTLTAEMPDDPKGIAKELGVELKSSGYFDRNTSVSPFDNSQIQKIVFEKSFRDDGLISEPISITSDSVIAVYVSDYKKTFTKKQEDVKEQLEKDFKVAESDRIALEKAKELRNLINTGDDSAVQKLVSESGASVTKAKVVKRTDSSFDSAVIDGIFSMPKAVAGINSDVFEGLDDHKYVVIVNNVVNFEGEPSEAENSISSSQIKQLNSARDSELLRKQLRADSKIEYNDYALKQYDSAE